MASRMDLARREACTQRGRNRERGRVGKWGELEEFREEEAESWGASMACDHKL